MPPKRGCQPATTREQGLSLSQGGEEALAEKRDLEERGLLVGVVWLNPKYFERKI